MVCDSCWDVLAASKHAHLAQAECDVLRQHTRAPEPGQQLVYQGVRLAIFADVDQQRGA